MRTAARLSLAILLCASGLLSAQETREEKMRRFLGLQRDVQQAFSETNYPKALLACEAVTNAFPKQADGFYNLACALARLGRTNDAVAVLSQSVALGYADPEHMKTDEDLASLRDSKAFQGLVARARKAELDAPFEKGRDIKGVKTVEAFPEGGLRYRLRMSETATAKNPHRLIVWLHPSGGSMNATVESMAPGFIAKGFALLVPTRKAWGGWSESDARRLLRGTLPDVAKIQGIDAKRPVLLGFSAGGQLALVLWRDAPQDFGGIVLDAAYPVQFDRSPERGRAGLMPLPDGKDFSGTPVFAIVGERDQNGVAKTIWEKAKSDWQTRVPLALHIVPGKGHEWLFGKEQTEWLHDWLSTVVGTAPLAVP